MRRTDFNDEAFLKAEDLPVNGKSFIIDRHEKKPVGQEAKEKDVLYFRDEPLGFVLNLINQQIIKQYPFATGKDTFDWSGGEIELYATTIEMNDTVYPCIRVRIPVRGSLINASN
jgi:hypothetical protein